MKEGIGYRLGWHGPKAPLAVFLSPETSRYGLLRCQQQQGELQIISWQDTQDPEELRGWISERSGQPLVLYLQDPLLLEKWIPAGGNLLSQTLGVSVDSRDGFWTQSRPADDGLWASVLSKQSWDEWEDTFKNWRKQIVHVCISPSVARLLLPILEQYDERKQYGLHHDEFPIGPQPEPADEVIEIEQLAAQLSISTETLFGYAAVLESLGNEVSAPDGIADPDALQNITRQSWLLTGAAGVVGLILCGWLLLFGLTDWKQHQIEVLETELAIHAPLLEELRSLEAQVGTLQGYERERSSFQASHIAQQLDLILHNAGTAWQLSEVWVKPDLETLRQIDRRLEGTPDLVIKGTVGSMAELTDILGRLENVSGIETELWKTSFSLSRGEQAFVILINWEL